MTIKKKVLLLIGLLAILAIVLFFLNPTAKTGLKIDSSPDDAYVLIKGKKYNSGYIPLKPGRYVVTIDHEAFFPQKRTVDVMEGKALNMTIFLTPDGAKGLKWLNAHPDEKARREQEGSRLTDGLVTEQVKNLPLMKELPRTDNFYSVSYGASKANPEDYTKVALYVRYYSEQGLADAKDWLIYKGIDIDKTEIVYIDAVAENE